jgi:hypothetical protein
MEMCGQSSNSRPPGSDTMMEASLYASPTIKTGDIEGARGSFIRFQHRQLVFVYPFYRTTFSKHSSCKYCVNHLDELITNLTFTDVRFHQKIDKELHKSQTKSNLKANS